MICITRGFPEHDRPRAVALFWEAFKGKLATSLGPETCATRFLQNVIAADYALCAHDRQGALQGMVGFKTAHGGLVGGGFHDLADVYGCPGALWRGVVLSIFERKLAPGQMLLDGIFVSGDARGQGIGTCLLRAVCDLAQHSGQREIRLDVIDSNTRAEALYLREGFRPAGRVDTWPLHPLAGFRHARTMIREL